MGYYTRYEVETLQNDTNLKMAMLAKDTDLAGLIASDLGGYNPFDYECKWYDHERDMREFSKKFPDPTFVLRGEGEDTGDLWVAYFKNGKSVKHRAVITYPDFDPAQLV